MCVLCQSPSRRAHAGPFIRVRVGDILDFTLLNKDDTGMAHNVSAGPWRALGVWLQLLLLRACACAACLMHMCRAAVTVVRARPHIH